MQKKYTSYRIYLVAAFVFFAAIAVLLKINNIQWVEGAYYRQLAKQRTVKDFVISANKGNIYSSDGSLLATSIPQYAIRFDALAPTNENFNKNIKPLADSLGVMFGKTSFYFESKLKKARANKNRYLLLARKLSYTDYMRIKKFPLFSLGVYKGGIIVDQKTVREHPIGKVAERTIGYQRSEFDGKGLEYAFKKYLNGTDGHRMMQKIAKNQWKPINDNNELEPVDGYDIISTVDVYIQDIAHHALLKQLEKYNADHGCVVVMETETGYVRAISNLGRAKDGGYFETQNYAVSSAQEPGSTFKLFDLIALLDDKKVDTSAVYDTQGGVVTYFNRKVRDSHKGGYGKISLANGFEKSSNTVLVQAVVENYGNNPREFVERANRYGFNKPLGLQFVGEGKPTIHQPGTKTWYGTSLPWMAFGYGISLTPLQTLTLYNAVANNGKMVKPLFVSEIKEWNSTIKKFEPEVIDNKIASDEALNKVRAVLENVVKRGTGKSLYSKTFSMAGKTGTAQMNYRDKSKLSYSSSFVGYFPTDKPKYSCIVVVNKPDASTGYYGADVAGPVFKRIAQKIYTDSPSTNKINFSKSKAKSGSSYDTYFAKVANEKPIVPNVVGMVAMDAIALLEKKGLKVIVKGFGLVKKQSIDAGAAINDNKEIIIELS